ncbi:UNVERIFIED_CONTAM: hypothetical protein FKN15_000255 [Acipenser sinensis]
MPRCLQCKQPSCLLHQLPSREPEGVELPSREPEGVELPSREPEGVELPSQKPEGVELPSRKPEGVELPSRKPEGVELPSREPEGVELLSREPEGVELPSQEPEEGQPREQEVPPPAIDKGKEVGSPPPPPPQQQTPLRSSTVPCPLPLAPGHPAGLPRPPGARPGTLEPAPSATALHLIPYTTLPEHPDVAGLLPDVVGAPPVHCFTPPG